MFGCFGAGLAQEGQGDLAHGVERGQQGSNRQGDKDQPLSAAKSVGENFIFRPETGGDHRETGKRKTTDQESPESDRHFLAQAAHVEHILRIDVVAGMQARHAPCRG